MGCELMKAALEQSRAGLKVVGYTTKSDAFRSTLDHKHFPRIDVAVISASLSDGSFAGFKLMREMRIYYPKASLITILNSSEKASVIEAFRCGASGILSREQPFEVVCKCIQAVHQGQVWATSKEMQFALSALVQVEPLSTKNRKGRTILTQREEALVQLVSEGFTNRDISRQLNLSVNTVRNYLFRIFNKVGASNRLELALYALNRRANDPQPEVGKLEDSMKRMKEDVA
jgi:two-component system nitrate/nitrite response regulator NarL